MTHRQKTHMYRERFMRRAIEISARALEEPGTKPFGAVVVRDGEIVGEGINRSVREHDPTSHGETEAIRDACRNLETVDLRGCQLYTSCEPCALCVAAMALAGIEHLYYAAGLEDSGAAMKDLPNTAGPAINSRQLRLECGSRIEDRSIPSEQTLGEEATEVLLAWAEMTRAAR